MGFGELKVVLDIDETLIHTYRLSSVSTVTNIKQNVVKKKVPKKQTVNTLGKTVTYKDGNTVWTIKFVKRPFLDEFLTELSNLGVTVIFWTSAEKFYADAVLNSILPSKLQKCDRLYRGDCSIKRHGIEVSSYKDLSSIFNEVQLQRVILLDDSPSNLKSTPFNGLLCPRWFGVLEDELNEPSLLKLALEGFQLMKSTEDITTVSKEVERGIWELVKTKREESERKRLASARLGSNRLASFTSGVIKKVKSFH